MRFRVFPSPKAPGEARDHILPLAEQMGGTAFTDLKTVVSELVTIGVAHGAEQPILLSLTICEGAVEGIVYDAGPGTRAIAHARQRGESSLALSVVDALVDQWGVNPAETRIWFRLPAPAPSG